MDNRHYISGGKKAILVLMEKTKPVPNYTFDLIILEEENCSEILHSSDTPTTFHEAYSPNSWHPNKVDTVYYGYEIK